MKISLVFSLINLIFFFCSCNGQSMKNPSSECIELNNKGTEYMMKLPEGGKNGLIKAISFFNQAINCDSTYLLAYRNLANAYDQDQNYKRELIVFDKALNLSGNNPSIITQKAEVFEKMGLLDSAKNLYQLAQKSFRDSLFIHPNDINFIRGFLLVIALTKGREFALKELNKRSALYPELKSKMTFESDFYINFDKKAYLYHLTQ